MPRQWRNSDGQVFEIEPRDDGRWALQREESKRASRVFDGKREAQEGALTCNGAAKRHIILERAVRVVAEQARRTNATIDHALATSPGDSAAGTPEPEELQPDVFTAARYRNGTRREYWVRIAS